MGEGWLLTAEMIELVRAGYENIVCAQPFGCLPNHICGKGMNNKIREVYPQANITPIDYDPSATRVNQENRIKLMIAVARERLAAEGRRYQARPRPPRTPGRRRAGHGAAADSRCQNAGHPDCRRGGTQRVRLSFSAAPARTCPLRPGGPLRYNGRNERAGGRATEKETMNVRNIRRICAAGLAALCLGLALTTHTRRRRPGGRRIHTERRGPPAARRWAITPDGRRTRASRRTRSRRNT